MQKQFRILRLVATIFKIKAWIVLIVGILGALAVVVLGAIGGGAMIQNPMLESVPSWIVGMASGLLGGLMAGFVIVIGALFYFVLLYAVAEVVYLGLAIEQNTRESAYYLRGEGALPPPPMQ